jgi:oligopeptidase A
MHDACGCRQLRETVYRAYLVRASDQEGESAKDNTKLINQVLQLKQEKAKLLGKANYAELSLASKMATFDQAMALLTQLRDSSHAAAEKELAQLRAFAAEKLAFKDEMMPWDVSFYAERLREAEFDFNEEELRPCVGD